MLVYTERLLIRNIQQSDLDDLMRLYNDREFYKYATGVRKSISRKEWLSRYYAATEDDNLFFSVATHRKTGDFIGCIKGSIKESKQPSLWISLLMVDRRVLRQGYGSEICENVIGFIKKKETIEHIYLSVDQRNEGACRFWEHIGFKKCYELSNYNRFYNEFERIFIYEQKKKGAHYWKKNNSTSFKIL